MNRDKQIELLKGAKARVQGNVATWLKDPRVKESLRRNHHALKERVVGAPVKKACG